MQTTYYYLLLLCVIIVIIIIIVVEQMRKLLRELNFTPCGLGLDLQEICCSDL